MIKELYIISTVIVLFSFSTFAQNEREKDLSLWTWFQVEKKIRDYQYAGFQYQARFNNNISQFNRSNLYFTYSINFLQHWQLEGLYQFNINRTADQHTFFVGLTYKKMITQRASLFYRTSFQTIRNNFSSDVMSSKPYSEWRNRIRFIYKINKHFSTAISVEPYLKFSLSLPPHLSRARFVFQLNYRYNKYQSLSVFYIIQPDIIVYSRPETDYVLGITYHFCFPNKEKEFKKIFKQKKMIKNNEIENEVLRDTFNQ
jgi:hypothetical protein